jgi:hypothetical protein
MLKVQSLMCKAVVTPHFRPEELAALTLYDDAAEHYEFADKDSTSSTSITKGMNRHEQAQGLATGIETRSEGEASWLEVHLTPRSSISRCALFACQGFGVAAGV